MATTKPLSQRTVPLLLCVLLCVGGCGRNRDDLSRELPTRTDMNVLIISFDALRADALGVYGYPRRTSPNIDQFAQSALVFDRAHAAAQATPTSFAAAFTGQLPFRVFRAWKLENTTTIAGLFADAGYQTFAVLNNTQLVAERNFQQGWSEYEVFRLPDESALARATAMLEKNKNKRFFGWIHFLSPHTPYEPRPVASHLYDATYTGSVHRVLPNMVNVDPQRDMRRVRNLYDGEVFYADHLFGRLVHKLEELGLGDNTLIVLTADHGEQFLEHGELGHRTLYEETIRIPLLIRHPDVRQHDRTDLPFLNVDLLPTLTGLTGIPSEAVLDGIDLRNPNDVRNRLRISTAMTNGKEQSISITRGHDKLIVVCKPTFREELYRLDEDPGEQQDRILDDPGAAGALYDALKQVALGEPCKSIRQALAGVAPSSGLTDEQTRQLKSLGYIQ